MFFQDSHVLKHPMLDASKALVGPEHKALTFPSVIKDKTNILRGHRNTIDPKELNNPHDRAILMVDQFKSKYRDTSKKLSKGWDINVNDFSNSLLNLVSKPDGASKLKQGSHNLCGPAAFLYFVIKRSPDRFCKLAIDLFESRLGAIGELKIRPDSDLVSQKFDSRWGIGFEHAADWLVMSSLRDSSNIYFDYEGSESEDVSGITLPKDISNWMKLSGLYGTIENDTNLVSTKDLAHLLKSKPSINRDICLFVDASIFGGETAMFNEGLPNHWVSLAQLSKINEHEIEITYFTWEEMHTNKKFKTDELLKHYYGYVSGERSGV